MARKQGRWASRIVGQAEVAPDQLLAHPENPRIHPAQQQAALSEVLDRVGWIQRVVVNKRTGHVIDGHLRVELAISQNEPTVPVAYVDLSLEEERLALATFDSIGAMAVVDSEMLAALLNDISAQMPEMASLMEQIADQADVALDPDPEPEPQPSRERYVVTVTVDSESVRDELVDMLRQEGYEPEVR